MQLLEAINRILPSLGEAVVTSVDSRNPTVAVIKNAIKAETSDLQLQEWWFNTSIVKLYPESSGEIRLPLETVSWVPMDSPSVQRGNRLYNTEKQSFNWDIGTPLKGKLKVRLDFEDLPEAAATVVVYNAAIKAYVDDIGMEENIQEWHRRGQMATVQLETEHLRNRGYSTRRSPRYQRIRRAIGV